LIDGLRTYPEMKPSGLPWLGDVPVHWDVRRNGRLFGPRRETGFPDLPVLEVSLRSGVRSRDFNKGARKQQMTDRSKYQRAIKGDLAYNMMRMHARQQLLDQPVSLLSRRARTKARSDYMNRASIGATSFAGSIFCPFCRAKTSA
jgi:hypothetical protein